MADLAECAEWLLAQYDADERLARDVSGATVIGERGNWKPSPGGDQWAASEGACEVEVLVGLRTGLPQPPESLSGYWGQVLAWKDSDEQYGGHVDVYLAERLKFARHIARHDPAAVLADIAAKRRIVKEAQRSLQETIKPTCADDYALEDQLLTEQGVWDSVLRLLAWALRDRDGYDPAWAPADD